MYIGLRQQMDECIYVQPTYKRELKQHYVEICILCELAPPTVSECNATVGVLCMNVKVYV